MGLSDFRSMEPERAGFDGENATPLFVSVDEPERDESAAQRSEQAFPEARFLAFDRVPDMKTRPVEPFQKILHATADDGVAIRKHMVEKGGLEHLVPQPAIACKKCNPAASSHKAALMRGRMSSTLSTTE